MPRPPALEQQHVRAKYNDIERYRVRDAWHAYTADEIDRLLRAVVVQPDDVLLYAGSGGRDHGVVSARSIHVDVAERAVVGVHRGVVASVESLPLATESVDRIICVGSVVNYCDAAAAIHEFGRVLVSGGELILEFESSDSLEFLGTPVFRRPVEIVRTFYNHQPETIWVYSRRYLEALLATVNVRVTRVVPIHLASPLLLRFGASEPVASRYSRLDGVLRRVRGFRDFACNFVFFCSKGISSRTKASIR